MHVSGAEVYRDLYHNPVDVVIFGAMTEYILTTYELSNPYMTDAYYWLVPTTPHKSLKWYRHMNFLDRYIWICISISIITVSGVLYFTAVYKSDAKPFQSLSRCFLTTFQTLLGQSVTNLPQISVSKIIIVVWIMLSIVLVTAFQTKLIADSYEDNDRITTIQQLMESQRKLIVPTDECPNVRNTSDCYFHYGTFYKVYLDYVVFNKSCAALYPRRTAVYYISQHYIDSNKVSLMYFLKESVRTIFISFRVARNLPILNDINKAILDLQAAGFMEYLIRQLDKSGEEAVKQQKI